MSDFNYKQITDPVHTTIGLSELEVKLISTRSFQRLRSVRQLGLAHFVFPGADYSRFSHSLGVCHVTGLILAALRENCPAFEISARDFQRYRLAGLLHDIGHYPFSHAMEAAVADHYSASLLQEADDDTTRQEQSEKSSPQATKFFNHERLGKEILEKDTEISSILNEYGFAPSEVSSIFLREEPDQLKNLVSSDCDADRIDYLMRTARHSGLPYGSIDLPYLLTQIRVDDSKTHVCITKKAIRAADHFLLSRYFDYAQVAYHKTVVALEMTLKESLGDLLTIGKIECSAQDITGKIEDGSWSRFTDAIVFDLIEDVAAQAGEQSQQVRARALVNRMPPKLVWEREWLLGANEGAELKRTHLALIRAKQPIWAEQFSVNEVFWKEWSIGTKLTKIGSLVPPSLLAGGGEEELDRYEQSIRVLRPDGKTTDIMSDPGSLMSVLSRHEMLKIRVYVLLPAPNDELVERVRSTVLNDLGG